MQDVATEAEEEEEEEEETKVATAANELAGASSVRRLKEKGVVSEEELVGAVKSILVKAGLKPSVEQGE